MKRDNKKISEEKEANSNLRKWIIRQTRPCNKCIFNEKHCKKCEGCDDIHSLYMEEL